MKGEPDRENILVQLRRERGLNSGGGYSIGIESLNRLVMQSGLTIGVYKLLLIIAFVAIASFALGMVFRGNLTEAWLITLCVPAIRRRSR